MDTGRFSHPGFAEPVRVERVELSDDPDTAVGQTIALMGKFARADSEADSIRRLCDQLRGVDQRDTVSRVWTWIKSRVRFVPDSTLSDGIPNSAHVSEVLVRPVDILAMRDAQGDCDDFSMLGACLFRTLGIPVLFCTVAADSAVPDQFSHVYLYVSGAPFDASHGNYVGWECPDRFGKKLLWSVETGMPLVATGLSGVGMTESTDSYWRDLLSQVTGTGLSIAQSRYGLPPEGTTIQTAGGVISRVNPNAPTSNWPAAAAQSAAIPTWMWLAAAALVALLLLKGKR